MLYGECDWSNIRVAGGLKFLCPYLCMHSSMANVIGQLQSSSPAMQYNSFPYIILTSVDSRTIYAACGSALCSAIAYVDDAIMVEVT